MLRAKAVTVNPAAGCGDCILQHVKRFKAISNATLVSNEEKDLLSPHSFHYLIHNQVLLSTALVLVQEASGNYAECRALLDSGSQVSFISRPCATRLNLEATPAHLHVEGVNAANMDTVNHVTRISLRSFHNPSFSIEVQAYVLPEVTADLPTISFTVSPILWPRLNLLGLADPGYNVSRGIDLLLGADCFPRIMRSEVELGHPGLPLAQSTVFGWALLGPVTLKIQLSLPSELDGEEGNGRNENSGNSSSRSPWIKLFDLRKHSHPGHCWLKELSIFQSFHARQQKQDLRID